MSPLPESISLIRSQQDADCRDCERLMESMNSTFHAVHDFIVTHRDERAANESYLGDLGRLIQAQVVAHRDLCRHQRQHAA